MRDQVLILLLSSGCHLSPEPVDPPLDPPAAAVSAPMTVKPGAPLRLMNEGPLEDGDQVLHVLVEEPVDALHLVVRDDVTLLTEIRLNALPAGRKVKVPLMINEGPRRLISVSARAWHQGAPQDRVMALWTRSARGEKVDLPRTTTRDPLGRRIISMPASQ